MTETPFTISVPDGELDLLRRKIELATFPDELEDAEWKYGSPLPDIKRLVERWKNGYDWRKHEKDLNDELPMFTRDVDVDNFDTLNIHYVHKKSEVKNAIPLLFCHGWPGSFFELPCGGPVCLDLGFLRLLGSKDLASNSMPRLMLSLGYDHYTGRRLGIGYVITRQIAAEYGGKHDKATQTCHSGLPPSPLKEPLSFLLFLATPWTAIEKEGLARSKRFRDRGSGYRTEQSTQPQTLGYSLADSPVGLLSWIYEKLHNWTDSYPWDYDEVLTWVSIYWFSRAGPAASLRIYFEVLEGQSTTGLLQLYTKIPMGVSRFPKELVIVPMAWVRRGNRIVSEFEHDSGGHLAAYEKPDELVDDVRKMFGKGGGAYGVVRGRDGYA